jgi:hypothetical protein
MSGECGTHRGDQKILVRKSDGKRPLGTPRHNGRIVLKWIVKKWDLSLWTGFSYSG